MIYHGVNLLHFPVKLDGLATLFLASGTSFFLFVWLLNGVLLGLLMNYFALLRRVPRAMHQYFFVTGWPISQMACIIFLVISRVALLGVGW